MLKRSVKKPLFVDQIDTERIKDQLLDNDLYEQSEETIDNEKSKSQDDDSD